MLGAIAAGLVRLALVVPDGSIFTNDTYNKMFTLHGVIMVWFFLIPSIPSTFGNFLLPLMIGAKDVAFPRLNLLSFYVFMTGAVFTMVTLIVGGVDTGWTFYTPLSTTFSNTYVVPALVGVIIVGFSSILTGLNFIVTIHTMRAPGLTWFRMRLFLWSIYATSLIFLLATPVITIALILLVFERLFHIGIFDPTLGGDPVLFEHMFWFYSHPAVYIMVLPGLGVISELVPAFSRKAAVRLPVHRVFQHGDRGDQLLRVGPPHVLQRAESVCQRGVLAAELCRRRAVGGEGLQLDGDDPQRLHPPRYADDLCDGLYRAVRGGRADRAVPGLVGDRRAYPRHVFRGGAFPLHHGGRDGAGVSGALHFWWPKITGRMYNEAWGRAAAILIFLGFNLTFFPQFILGYLGMPRRYHVYPPEFQFLNILSSAGSTILAAGYIFPMVYLLWSLWYGKKAPDNPWDARGLEWETTSPPPPHNFLVQPIVTTEPYDYGHRVPESG